MFNTLFSRVIRIGEAALPMNQSYDSLRGHISSALMKDHGVSGYSYSGPYIHDVFPSDVVYQHDGVTYRRGYKATQGAAGTDPVIALDKDKKKVHRAYSDTKEAEAGTAHIVIDGEKPKESVVTTSQDGVEQVFESVAFDIAPGTVKEAKISTIPIKVIGAGWGSSAYYSKEVLMRDGPSVFKKGTHMMWNHATSAEESQRPEGDLHNLAAVLVEDAKWQESGAKGPGLYSKAKVFSDYATQVSEKGAHIGVSINAGIKAHEGEAEGRRGRIADKFVYAISTDFVTKAGAGGAPLVPVSESQRVQPNKENATMTEEEIKALEAKNKALEADVLKLKENAAKLEAEQDRLLAVALVGAVLKEAKIEVKQSLVDRVCSNPVIKEGKVDAEWVKAVVKDITESFVAAGAVRGMGGDPASTGDDAEMTKEEKEAFQVALESLGVPAEKGKG